MNDPENYRIVDLIGFTCNLFGEYSLDVSPREIQAVISMYDYAEKIRWRAYRNYPDDIWVMRGYAWCHHVKARFKYRTNEKAKAYTLLYEARKIRLL